MQWEGLPSGQPSFERVLGRLVLAKHLLPHPCCPVQGAVDAYGAQDARLWLRYLEQEQQHGKGAGQVYWRAVKALDDPEPFIAECQLRQLQQ